MLTIFFAALSVLLLCILAAREVYWSREIKRYQEKERQSFRNYLSERGKNLLRDDENLFI